MMALHADRKTGQTKTMSAMAAGRAQMYGLFARIFGELPDNRLVHNIRQGRFRKSMGHFLKVNQPDFDNGLDYISAYSRLAAKRSDELILEELCVDRTRIVRGTGHPDMVPPYEGLYKARREKSEWLLAVKRFYIGTGLTLDGSNQEAPDFLGTELDFMRMLCQRENRHWRTVQDAVATVRREHEFLTTHLASWIGDYCLKVKDYALTDFYRGFAVMLSGFIILELDFLQGILGTPKKTLSD